MDPNQWNYNIQYGHTPSGALPPVHPSLNRLDLTTAGLSHQLQSSRGVPSLQSVNYQALSGFPILDTLTSGLSAQGHQLVFNSQANRISAESQAQTPTQTLASPHQYETSSIGDAKSAGSRATPENFGRNQLLEAARMWTSSAAASFTSPTSLYNQFNAALFPQSVEVSAPGQVSISPVLKSSQNQNVAQQHHYLQEPPPAHSSNTSASSRLLPVLQRPPEHGLQASALDVYTNSRSTPVPEPINQASRPQYTTHKAVVLGVGNNPFMRVQNLHRQTPVQQQQPQQQLQTHSQHQQHVNYQSLNRGGDIEDLSSGTNQTSLYGSYANVASDPQNFINSASSHNHQQHLNTRDLGYEAVSPVPVVQQQRQQQQQQSNISDHHQTLSLQLSQFPELSNITPGHTSALTDKFQIDSRLQSNQQHQQQHLRHSESSGSSSTLQRQQGSVTPSLKIPSQQIQQRVVSDANRYQSKVQPPESQSLNQILSAGRQTPVTQHQALSVSSGSLLNSSTALSPVQAMADSTTKPKRSRSRKKKVEAAPLATITPATMENSGHPQVLSQLHEPQKPSSQPQSAQLLSSNAMNQNDKSNLPLPQMQQQRHLSQSVLGMPSPSPHISTLSMAPSLSLQQSNYARAQTPSTPQNFSLSEPQDQVFQQSSIKPTQHNPTGVRQEAEYSKPRSTYKQAKKSPAKSKSNVAASRQQQQETSPAFPQLGVNLTQQRSSMQNSSGKVSGYTGDQQQHKQLQVLSSPHVPAAEGSYSKLLSQGGMLVEGVEYAHLQQPDHLLDDEENSAQQQHFQMDFESNQPFMEELAGVSAPASTYGGAEVVLTSLGPQEGSMGLLQEQLETDLRSSYPDGTVDDMRPVAVYTEHQPDDLVMTDVGFNMFPQDGQQLSLQDELPPPPEPEMTLTYVPHVVEDDELGHLADSSVSEPVPMLSKEQNQPRVSSLAPSSDSFQNSFLSYLQGHKQETLSSVSSAAVTKKPQLPKYIPEPPRPKPPPPPPTAEKPSTSRDSLLDQEQICAGTPSQKESYSVHRTSDLAVKIVLPKSKSKSRFGPFAESTLLKDSMQKNRDRKKKRERFSDEEEFFEESLPLPKKRPAPKEKSPPPARTSIGRKAKDKCMEMTKKNRDLSDSDEEYDFGVPQYRHKPKSKVYKSDDSIYNSDEDPAWMPFDVDLNQGDLVEKKKKPRRPKVRFATMPKPSKHGGRETIADRTDGSQSSHSASDFKIGDYMIEKKDLHNVYSYPIWRMEVNNLMKKFELKKGDSTGRIKHVATGTYSTLMPSMEKEFQAIKVREIVVKEKTGVMAVEVLEECRPKSQGSVNMEADSDEDPLVDPFSIYLQVFLSQALEPNFLTVIQETDETFYLDALKTIDDMIDRKCKEITMLARWKPSFQEAVHCCPLMKEIDRPNLKQPCQASESGSPPCIKSVFLSGLPYDRFLLTEKSGTSNPQEFMIGKLAAYYVRTYHSLYHFKYWLRQRCDAKVKMTKESNKAENLKDETILDKCLENRSWVLQLLDSLKTLLKSGSDALS